MNRRPGCCADSFSFSSRLLSGRSSARCFSSRAFSLIELMVVIGLIAILSSLLLIGVGHLITNSKRQQTRLAFQNLHSMYAEWDAVARHHFPTFNDPGVSPNDVAFPCPQDVTADAFTTAVQSGSPGAVQTADRENNATLFARDIVSLMRAFPANTAALGKMSATSLMAFQYPNNLTPFAPPAWVTGVSYNVTDRVNNGDPTAVATQNQGYACIRRIPYIPPSPGTPYFPPVTDANFWIPCLTDPSSTQVAGENPPNTWLTSTVPLLLDGWGNPIIFIPSGIIGSGSSPLAGGGSPGVAPPKGWAPIGSGALVTSPGSSASSIQVRSPDGRPFWASAGPDGNFALGDDNLYSFEK